MKMDSNDYNILISKYLDNEVLTNTEKDMLEKWVLESKVNESYFKDMVRVWEASNINKYKNNKVAKAKLKEFHEIKRRKKTRKLINWSLSSVAAVALLLVCLQFLGINILHDNKIIIVSTDDVKQEIVLPDGSSIWLNAHSSVSYPKRFKRSREVYLTGEALFDVEKRSGKSFTVNTDNISIEVLGTVFLVNDRESYNESETVLESGIINVKLLNSEESTVLEPGHRFVFDKKDNKSYVEAVNSNAYTDWISDKLSFNNTPLNEVFIQLEKWYNVEIFCDNQRVLVMPVSITVDEEPLEETLTLLTHILPIDWKFDEEKRVIIK